MRQVERMPAAALIAGITSPWSRYLSGFMIGHHASTRVRPAQCVPEFA
jgi:hypothetical protein